MSTPTTAQPRTANGAARPEVDGLRDKWLGLGRAHAAEALAEELSDAVQHHRPAHGVLDRLLAREVSARDERRVKAALSLSHWPPGLTLGNFDFGSQPSSERRPIETLATCAFIRGHATLLVQGPPGVGKTHLVVALGARAIEQGFRAAFYRLEELLHEMRQDAAVSPQALRGKKYFNVSYLVVDEMGFEPLTQADASLFFRLVSYRYRRGSTALTTTKGVKSRQRRRQSRRRGCRGWRRQRRQGSSLGWSEAAGSARNGSCPVTS